MGNDPPKKTSQRNLTVADSKTLSDLPANYNKSWAVVIGINHYENLNGLDRANLDASGIAELLISKLGFPKGNVFVVLDPPPDNMSLDLKLHSKHATKEVIEELIFNRLPQLAKVNDRVLIFYAGHGERRQLSDSKMDNIGYLVPSDAVPDKWHTFIEWEAIMRAGDYCPAKHMFYLLDACYSGIAASRAAIKASRFNDDMLKARVRQVLTAGTAKQAVTDIGPKGHSLFTSYVLEGLNGAAAMFDKSIITASELMVYVRNRVAPDRNSKQTPAFSNLDTEPGGDFVFALPPHKKPAADLSRWVRILDQGLQGVPVSHAVVMAMEASLRQQGISVRLSPQKLVELGRMLDSTQPEGGEHIKTIINAAQAFGMPVDKLGRGSSKARANVGKAKVRKSIPQASCNARCTLVKKIDDIPDQLVQGRSVILGLAIYDSFTSEKTFRTGEFIMPSKKDMIIGGHALTIVGYNPELDSFRFANSWGNNWGDHGFGTIKRLTLEKCLQDQLGIWAVEATLFVWGS